MENFSSEFINENGNWVPTKHEINLLKKKLLSEKRKGADEKKKLDCDDKMLTFLMMIKKFNEANGKWVRDYEKWKKYDECSSLAEYFAILSDGKVIQSAHRLSYRTEDVKNDPSIQKDGVILINIPSLSLETNHAEYGERQAYALSKLISSSDSINILPTLNGRLLMRFVIFDVYFNTGIPVKNIEEIENGKSKMNFQKNIGGYAKQDKKEILECEREENEDDYYDMRYKDEDEEKTESEYQSDHRERFDEGFDYRYMGEDPSTLFLSSDFSKEDEEFFALLDRLMSVGEKNELNEEIVNLFEDEEDCAELEEEKKNSNKENYSDNFYDETDQSDDFDFFDGYYDD